MRIIDFHTHMQDSWFAKPLPDRQDFLRALEREGVQAACIFTLMGFYGDCERENDILARHAAECSERLIPFATVDPKIGAAAVEEAERCLANPIFRGLKFHNWLQAFAPSMARETMTEILKVAARYDVPVLFHDGTPPYSTTFQIAALARWVPEAKIVLGHGGLADYVYAAGQLLRELPNLYVCCCGPKSGDVRYLVEMAGPERALFGSDLGFAHSRLLSERLDEILLSGIPEEVLDNVLYANAAQLLHLKDRPLGNMQ